MKSRDVVRLFFSTLLLGGVSTLLVSFFVKSSVYAEYLNPFNWFEILGLLVFFVTLGFVFSLISQMGFFAYLTVNQFALGIFRSYWPTIQIGLIIFALFDLVYFRYQRMENGSIIIFILTAVALLIFSLIVARRKAKETNKRAFIPALFFMIVITSIEWVPGLRTNNGDYAWLMIIPLILCNTYQLLILHRLTKKK
ncbi:KinB-signaling pathway activation protein [Gracilibacillus caseinilyticus]|uniref:KinB-signaling pathway activation protein n=1 Tax=Gracilibacillus caseinilyticus TaxID=2932256 RepID=A0ABY4EYM7_9BACI|nr:KinB-signaling pathway activation protein [Gracilibacillus caseinilyticus]UOQ49378.1 KinB-signaling pathway activation protein [Gracilibacillus caseinilyticus]